MANPASAVFYQSALWHELREACFRRDGYHCVVAGCGARATHCDHIKRRPHAAGPTPYDTLANLRSLCGFHDAQIKETRGGIRRGGGAFTVRGAGLDGWPLDPKRR